MGWKDDLDRKFLDTIRQLKLQKAELEQRLLETQKALTESGEIKKSLASRVTQQTLLITELRDSHPQLVEIDDIYDETLENRRRRRSQIMRLKLELEHSRKSSRVAGRRLGVSELSRPKTADVATYLPYPEELRLLDACIAASEVAV